MPGGAGKPDVVLPPFIPDWSPPDFTGNESVKNIILHNLDLSGVIGLEDIRLQVDALFREVATQAGGNIIGGQVAAEAAAQAAAESAAQVATARC